MLNSNPIGIFDSGVGGLSVAKSIRSALPNEELIYVADSLFAPYGDKSRSLIAQRSHDICQFFVQQQVKAIVIACNTATVTCIAQLRAQFELPIIGMEPAIKPAALQSISGVVAVLATQQTVTSGAVDQLVAQFSANAQIIVQACPGLVELVEQSKIHTRQSKLLLQKYLRPLLDQGVDTIVMGCTHYTFLLPVIEQIVGSQIKLVTSHAPVAKELERRLSALNLLSTSSLPVSPAFYSSDTSDNTRLAVNQLWGEAVNLSALVTTSAG